MYIIITALKGHRTQKLILLHYQLKETKGRHQLSLQDQDVDEMKVSPTQVKKEVEETVHCNHQLYFYLQAHFTLRLMIMILM